MPLQLLRMEAASKLPGRFSRGPATGLALEITQLTNKVDARKHEISASPTAFFPSVSWSGTLEVPGKLKGVRIRWEYAPQVCTEFLFVEGGKVNKEGSRVVLSPCEDAIALGDGRELWLTNPQGQIVSARSQPPQCLVLQGGDTTGKWRWRSRFELVANFKLNFRRRNCLPLQVLASPRGRRRPLLLGLPGQLPAAPRQGGVLVHDSEEFVRLAAARIEWEQPALAYTIQASVDGAAYM
ncbi:LCCL domain-containing protein, related [Eimeria necatrix]|uniref:LCCL domain-containing protein, related n=1 Tax=Eimeria necatrix TaxID=51315 RepID=U6MS48_9EIME|nr:LCCL domain-containing protein, related [Eimeria necatrix]CDJ65294.1 LCCL domain-containing protein, related [Eimeria necatrix]